MVSYLQLAHSERHPVTGVPVGEGDPQLRPRRGRRPRRAGPAGASISRFLDPQQAIAAARAGEVRCWTRAASAGRGCWTRSGSGWGSARRCTGSPPGGGLDGERGRAGAVRAGGPAGAGTGRKLAATGWVAERVAIDGCAGFSDDAAYRAMDFLLDALGEIAAAIFDSVAHLLNLDVDIVFVDTTSTYWEVDGADELADLRRTRRPTTADQPGRGRARRRSASPRTTATTCRRW